MLNGAPPAAPAFEAARIGSQPHSCFSTFSKELPFSANRGTSLCLFNKLLKANFSAAC